MIVLLSVMLSAGVVFAAKGARLQSMALERTGGMLLLGGLLSLGAALH